ncbi:OmpA family protein [Hymenobacter metallicola]|uniref:OmpA family protein n=1 Tax=Hymenobacter metallicola TaxID=2563114 RepID=A0A4Z0QHF6_9BACT|nr:OmpA family protein [Hymenobacter metallicola]TGE28739.1 OmpA family protein [Hymenobacter metallicola]
MKRSFWYSLLILLLAGPGQAQTLTGNWQGVETDTGEPGATWPAVLRLQKGKGTGVFGVLYQEMGGQPGMSVTFQVQGTPAAKSLRIDHVRKLNETGTTPFSYWCEGSITFTYDPTQEKLTGKATYKPIGDCDQGTFTLYRVKLKSAATVAAGAETTLRVSGRNVLWFADAELQKPVATGNTFRTRLSKTTTFYLTQSYYPTRQSPVTPITIQVSGPAPKPAAPKPAAPPTAAVPAPLPAKPDTARPAPPPPLVAPTPAVLPTVLFKLGTAELLAESFPALNQLVAELNARPTLQLRVAGHTDRIGEPQKNQTLSEQRAEAVKAYLVKAGIAAARITTIGYGDSRPLYPSPDARNRRVEVAENKE